MARLGYLLLRDGHWEDKQLLPSGWVQAATKRRAEFDREKGYGYLNWVRRRPDIVKTAQGDINVQGYFAYGHHGQFIGVYPELDLLIITTADATDAMRDTYFVPDLLHDFVRRFIFPAFSQSHSPSVEKIIRKPSQSGVGAYLRQHENLLTKSKGNLFRNTTL